MLAPGRANGFVNMLEAMRRRTRFLTAQLPTFPSLLIDSDGITAQVSAPPAPTPPRARPAPQAKCLLLLKPVLAGVAELPLQDGGGAP